MAAARITYCSELAGLEQFKAFTRLDFQLLKSLAEGVSVRSTVSAVDKTSVHVDCYDFRGSSAAPREKTKILSLAMHRTRFAEIGGKVGGIGLLGVLSEKAKTRRSLIPCGFQMVGTEGFEPSASTVSM